MTMRMLQTAVAFCAGACLTGAAAQAEDLEILLAPADSPRWSLLGRTEVSDYLGLKAIKLNGGSATLADFEMSDGVIDVDVATPAPRGFFGIEFRANEAEGDSEWVYLRQHKSGQSDAMQYTPVLNTGLNWQLYNGPGYTGAVDIPKNEWFHMRLVLTGAQAKFYVENMDEPALVIDDLKSGVRKGGVAFSVLTGETYFSNFKVTSTSESVWEPHPEPTPAGALTQWRLSPAYDALERNLEAPLSLAEIKNIEWQQVTAEGGGIVPVNRYRESPHPRVTFQSDFSTRLEPQPGMKVVYARTTIHSDQKGIRKLYLGYSDDVSVFLNGQILYRGRSAQSFRDPGFLGVVSAENDAVYLPMKKGDNELVLAVSELGGGWGFVCRLSD